MGMPLIRRHRPEQRHIVVGIRALDHRIEIGVSAAQKDVAPDPALHRRLDTHRPIGLGIQRQLVCAIRLQLLLKS